MIVKKLRARDGPWGRAHGKRIVNVSTADAPRRAIRIKPKVKFNAVVSSYFCRWGGDIELQGRETNKVGEMRTTE